MARVTKLDTASPYPPGWEPFLAAINADLDEDTPRLVFADWLQENGDEARAQFIRIQCAEARGGDGSEADALLTAHRARWLAGLPKFGREKPERVTFRRGFVTGLIVRGRDWASTSAIDSNFDANGQAIRRVTALEDLSFEQVWNTVVEGDAVRGLRTLALPSAGSGLIESLATSPALPTLTGLDIRAKSSNGVSQRSFRMLLGNAELARLRRLRIESMHIGNVIVECLDAPHFTNLEELRLRHVSINATGALAALPCIPTLRVLDLTNNSLWDGGLSTLLATPALRNLEELVLAHCHLTSASARALAAWEGLRSVRRLNLLGNRMRRADAELIAASPHALNLTDLEAPLGS